MIRWIHGIIKKIQKKGLENTMTEAEQADLNAMIAIWEGWSFDAVTGVWSDPTGLSGFRKPKNYTDNSGLWIGLKYRLHIMGWSIGVEWPCGNEPDITVILTVGDVDAVNRQMYIGVAKTEALAGCLAIKNILTQKPFVKK